MRSIVLRLLVPTCVLLGVVGSPHAASAAPAHSRPCTGAAVPAGASGLPRGVTAASWVVADLDSGAILGSCAPDARRPPASTLKLLTALVVLPRVDLDRTVTVTPADVDIEPGSSAVGLVAGGTYRVETLLLGLMLVSGNDAAKALARVAGGAGGLPGTIVTMNARAAALGATETTAVNPHGLDAPGQLTSARDLAVITRAAFALPELRRIAATPTAQVPAQRVRLPDGTPKAYPGFQVQNDNRLLTTYPGAFGGKTGFTDEARHTFVGAAERHGRRLVVTLMGAEQMPLRTREQAGALLDWAFALPSTAAPVGALPPAAGPEEPAPAVRGVAVERTPAAVVTPTEAAAGPGVAALWVLGVLTALVTALRIRVKLRLARRRREREALRRRRMRAAPMQERGLRPPPARPGSGRPARAVPRPPRGRAPSRVNPSR
jgi:D-alanyl-D-alanine carboxypeptidase (penicillin-binding protein 5/6)